MLCLVDRCMIHDMTIVLQKLREQLKSLEEELHKTPVTLEELKQVLNIINTIKSTSMNMELRYVDLEERFRYVTKSPYGISCPICCAVVLVPQLLLP